MTRAVLVTGGTGAIGRAAVARLRDEGWAAVTASRSGADRVLDVTDRQAVVALVGELQPAAVVHLAAALPGSDLETLKAVNIGGTDAVAEACARTGARLVFASS